MRAYELGLQVFEMPAHVREVSEIPADFVTIPLGTKDEVIARIKGIFPEADFSDRSWGVLVFPEFSIEFSMGAKEVCDGFGLIVRGGGKAMEAVAYLLEGLQLRAFDCQTSEFFSMESARESFKEWQAFRDRGLRQIRKDSDPSTGAV